MRCGKFVPTRSKTPPGFKGGKCISPRCLKSFFHLDARIGWHLISNTETTHALSMSIKVRWDWGDTLKETYFDSNSEVLEIAFVIGRVLQSPFSSSLFGKSFL